MPVKTAVITTTSADPPSPLCQPRWMRASHLRALHAATPPCPYTLQHVAIAIERRALDLLTRMPPRLFEMPDGTLVPGQTAPEVSAALATLPGDPWIEVLISGMPPSDETRLMLPLAADFRFRTSARLMTEQAEKVFCYWQRCGVMEVTQQVVARELMMSPSTYNEKIGWCYPYAHEHDRQ